MKHSMNNFFWSLKNLFFVFLPVSFLIIPTVLCASEWQEKLEQHFDVVETFDELQDWYGIQYEPSKGDAFIDLYPDDFPKRTDGTPSIWCYYSKWADPQYTEEPWIGNFGDGTYWGTGGKSAIIDLSNVRGPSRLGTYFGTGESKSGYKDVYVFYMVKISRNQWPTRCEKDGQNVTCSAGGTGIYEDEKDYSFWGSWKFNTIGIGWNSCRNWNGNVPDHAHRYGAVSIVPYIKSNNYGPVPRVDGNPEKIQNLIITVGVKSYSGGPIQDITKVSADNVTQITSKDESQLDWNAKGVAVITDEWMGVEFHYVMSDPAGAGNNGRMEAWIYNKEGKYERSFYVEGINYVHTSQNGHRFNRFFLGGNNSSAYEWGPTMEAPYYVDDFIIHKSRIGPTYFGLLKGNDGVLAAPANLRITAVEPQVKIPVELPLKLDFDHPETAATHSGWTSFSVNRYASAKGYGWESTSAIASRDRESDSANALQTDFHQISNDSKFLIDLSNGQYSVTLYFGDADYGHNAVDVYAEDDFQFTQIVKQGNFTSESFNVNVSDGQLDISFKNIERNTTVNGLEVIDVKYLKTTP